MLVKEFQQIFRNPRMRFVLFGTPIIQMLVFGYVVSMDVRNIRTAVADYDNSVESRELVSRFERSGYFDIVERADGDAAIREALDHGWVLAALKINTGFGEKIRSGRTAPIQIILDGTDSNTSGIALGYCGRIASQYSQNVLVERLRKRGMRPPAGVVLESRAWFNDNLESRNYFLPGVMSSLVMLATLMLTSMAIVREKEIGTMEQLMVTPIKPSEFIIGKTIPFALVGFMDVIFITCIAVFWFHVPIRGSLLLLFFATSLFLLTSLSIGLLISSVSSTQQQAIMSTFLFFYPAMMISGFMFPIRNMPLVVQWITYLNPMRYFLVIIRGIFLKGIGMSVLWPQYVALAVMGAVMLFLSTRRVRKTLA
jgi:ABC-2 type transport system permease protein